MFILRAPNVLVIQLKRFEPIHGGKINRNIDFEEGLVLSKFMSVRSQDPQPEYSLFGSIVHSGYSRDAGHYYAYVKDASGRWYRCNDAHVSPSCSQEVLSEKVYILFYIRSNQSPSSVWSHHNKQQMSSTPNGNVSKCQLKVKEHGTNGTHIVATSRGENDCDHASGNMISGMKRKSSNDNMPETSFQFGQKSWDLTGKYGQLQNTYQSKHSPEGLEKFKEVIGEEIRSDLQSCGWVDKVDAFMSIRKKFCRLTMDKLPGDTELRIRIQMKS
ncbi:hypothetical protein J5N97_000842 [Dioscorea zingiberensis]|uniref:ubiquitinyl hydrolase 1 n=1 Tax=Dioscorea zingiberensis TaxID=325984 RepID=A0A9D5H2R5_9LILI|nr:hypothetical protein J5N97_000842 [Dioscorea zingiberensis]